MCNIKAKCQNQKIQNWRVLIKWCTNN
jgi:hypothetical protein